MWEIVTRCVKGIKFLCIFCFYVGEGLSEILIFNVFHMVLLMLQSGQAHDDDDDAVLTIAFLFIPGFM